MLLGLVAFVAAAPAPAMTVGEFLTKADALEKKGLLAVFSSDLGLIKSESRNDIDAFAAHLADPVPPACPPRQGTSFKFTVTSDELLGFYRSMPPQGRTISAKQGFAEFMSKKYPCPKQ